MNQNQLDAFGNNTANEYMKMQKEMIRTESDDSLSSSIALNDYYYLKITEISRRWILDEKPLWHVMSGLFVGLFQMSLSFSLLLVGDGSKLSLYAGSKIEQIESLQDLLRSTFPQIRFAGNSNGGVSVIAFPDAMKPVQDLKYGGFLRGNPVGNDNYINVYQMDAVVKGMTKKRWACLLFANPVDRRNTLEKQQRWLAISAAGSLLSNVSFSNSDNVETVTYRKTYQHGEEFIKKVQDFCEKTTESCAMGEWDVTMNFLSDSELHARLLGGLLSSSFFSPNAGPEPVHAIYNTDNNGAVLTNGQGYMHYAFCKIPYPKYSSLLSSKELAVLAAFPTVDTSGLTVMDQVDFDVNREIKGDLSLGNILDSGLITENKYSLAANELNRHCLVIGLTGSGKTNTIKSMLVGYLHNTHKPFLVIEPAKKEYWELYKLGIDNLQIYSVGSSENNAHRFCINPFERTKYVDFEGAVSKVPIQTHIDYVYAAFKASFIMYTPMPYVLERAIYAVYEDCGWDIHNDRNLNGQETYPTIEDLYFKIPVVVTEMGYDQKMKKDLIGSLQARINSLRIGTKGDTLNVSSSFPFGELLEGNVVIELEDVGDDDAKAFIISLILISILEYRRQQTDCQLEVRHLLLIEEAHRLLKNIQSGTGENADPRGAAVEFFCNMLAEMRSKGQGFIISDQIPSKLAPDLVKNTNLKIAHRTVDEMERRVIGGSMHMTEEQIDYLSSLKQGVAAVYSEGDHRPKLVKAEFAGEHIQSDRKELSRSRVLEQTFDNCIQAENNEKYRCCTNSRTALCRLCSSNCRKQYTDIVASIKERDSLEHLISWLDPRKTKPCNPKEIEQCLITFVENNLKEPSHNKREDKYCLLNYMFDRWELDHETERELMESFENNDGFGKGERPSERF